MDLLTSWPAPAKLNLFLHVTGRRADGYHLLQTVFQFLDYGDEIRFSVRADGRIMRTRPLVGVPEDRDLCVRAARALQQAAGVTLGADIELEKRLPQGGGLGGGSSDAATTLLALNELWRIHWDPPKLAELGLKLGADVPVFVRGSAAWAEGVGEVLVPVELPQPWYVVVVPPVLVSTAAVFADPELTRHSPAITIRDFYEGRVRNDLTPVVRRRYPEVDTALTWLGQFGDARMTGSGGCVFLPVADVHAGEMILKALARELPRPYSGFVARGLNAHPIHARLQGNTNWGVAKR